MTEWMKELTLMVEAEYHARRIVATLATVGLDGLPYARTVIIRNLDASAGAIWFTTDGRSAKVAQLDAQPIAELVFWAVHERVQFRVRGAVELVRSGPIRQDIWLILNDPARAMFFWPTPGRPRQPDDLFPAAVPSHEPPPDSFIVVALRPVEAESLELNDRPHRRRRWRAVDGWNVELLNP